MADSKLIAAADMRRAVSQDPQFTAPVRPSLCRGMVVVPFSDGVLIEGGPSRQVLRGAATRELVPTLLPLLDGTRNVEETAAEAGVPVPHVEQVVALLYTCGLLEDGEVSGAKTPAGNGQLTDGQSAEGPTDRESAVDGPTVNGPTVNGQTASGPAPGGESASSVFWSRSLDSTRVNRSAAQVEERLATARVSVIADGDLGKRLQAGLVATGFAHVTREEGPVPSSGADLVVVVGEDGRDDGLTAAEWCAVNGVPLLPGWLHGTTLDLGPYIDPEFTVTYAEVLHQRAAAGPGSGVGPETGDGLGAGNGPETGNEPEPGARPEPGAGQETATGTDVPGANAPAADVRGAEAPETHRTMAVALITDQVAATVGRIGSSVVLRGMVRTELDAWEQEIFVMAPVPDVTDEASAKTAGDVPLALAFESSVGFPPRKLLNPRDHQVHYKPGNIALQRESKRWPSARTLDLPRTDVLPSAPLETERPPFTDRLGLAELASVLLVTAGRKEEAAGANHVPRWAPTGGNLGSVTLHVVVSDVAGVPAGTWGYDSAAHRLARLPDTVPPAPYGPAPGAETGSGQGAESGAGPEVPAATLVLTGSLARVASKYATFAWRIVHLDAGAALAQASMTARALGLSARPLSRWDDQRLARTFDLDLDTEPVTGVLELRPSRR
ncbi:nitroreductase family protein [Streptomyces iconiensis]|uniref:Nitroreductase family protein n=1 Tax=Streptomyces iconiensis TaxID=1384038 RepID=A0ABT6ZVD8_9ACTN|nr:nitroreductase family protein [Streptomyces iconiensis]MDJ1132792.1 nitroreductase family protein [Streptomyces iconiensis]